MKALVVARLLLGDIDSWDAFRREREVADRISNRRTARSVASQIGKTYRGLSIETRKFIANNFARCDYDELARLCDAVEPGVGLYLRLDEFENSFFPLALSVKQRFPFYAHVSISIYGLQFEFPEHHFVNDLREAFDSLRETWERIDALGLNDSNVKQKREDVGPLLIREKFISRSMVSASFSLIEAFLSGLFYSALKLRRLGKVVCDENFLHYAEKKEGAALKDRLDHIVKFASSGATDVRSEPFKSFVDIAKSYRDAIHHATPFERKKKNLDAGQRLLMLYEVKSDVAILCALLSLASILKISSWLYGEGDTGEIATRCNELNQQIASYALEQGMAKLDAGIS